MGFPLALKMREVVPMREAARVMVLTRSKIRKDIKISREEEPQSASSPLENKQSVSS